MTITQQPSKLAHIQIHFEQQLNELMANISPPAQLKAAIQHSLLAPGKRIRPRLIYAIGLALNASLAELDGAAMAIECMHCYSLIHDDLPAMDDADTRRGRPSSHKQFGEAQAILTGDALLSLSFECLNTETLDAKTQCQLMCILAKASGAEGMVAGQWMDMDPRRKTKEQVATMHQLKTGALFKACLQMACAITQNPWSTHWESLAQALGICYQLQDDLMDVHSDPEITGKPQGQDERSHKTTFCNHLDPLQAKHHLQQHQQKIMRLLTHMHLDHHMVQEAMAIFFLQTDDLSTINTL